MVDSPARLLDPVTDVLPGWEARTIALSTDGTAPDPVATLVHRAGQEARLGRSRAALYIHGFVDYFFQVHHARVWEEAGFDFHALDLRDYGRSIRPGRLPNRMRDLDDYDEELTAALSHLRTRYRDVVLVGHSTGGLIAARYAARHPGMAAALVLNSPWLDLNEPLLTRCLLVPLVRRFGHLAPNLPISTLGSGYGRSLHVSTGGEWEYDLAWKPLDGFGVFTGWLAAILRGHRDVARGLGITVPLLMATSGARGDNNHPTRYELAATDVVLSPPQMWRLASRLGSDVTVLRINGGRHDLSLSLAPARARFHRELTAWLTARFPR